MRGIWAAGVLFFSSATSVVGCGDDTSSPNDGGGGTVPTSSSSTTTNTSSSAGQGGAGGQNGTGGQGGAGGQNAPEICDDSADNDGDGAVDCADTDCATQCPGDSCANAEVVTPGSSVMGDTTSASSTVSGSCAIESGPELIYQFVAPTDGTLILNLFSTPDLGISLRTDCADESSEILCIDMDIAGDTELVTQSVVAGTTYFIVLDGYSLDDFGTFTLDVTFEDSGPRSEPNCHDMMDDDGNGLIDCADPSCQTTAICTPGAGAAGTPCAANNECAASGHDPFCYPTLSGRGYCSEFCDLAVNDCGGDSLCLAVDVTSTQGACFDGCTTGADCLAGQDCDDAGDGTKFCIPN